MVPDSGNHVHASMRFILSVHHTSSHICNHICHKKTFGNFPKIHPIWYFYPSLSDNFKSRDPSASKNDIGFDWLEPLSTDLFIVLFSRLVGGREGLEIETEIHRFQVQRINHGPGMVCVFQPELIEGKKRKYTFYSKCISNSKVLLQWSRY